MKIGSLFSGYGGLDLAVKAVTGAEVAWHTEWEDAPSKVLEANFPGVPNFHDVSKVDWTQVEPVDILTGGFPCQDLSLAGKRAGLKEGTRSGLWLEFAKAIEVLQPRLVVIENVRGLLSATAHGDLEQCPWCVGEAADGEPVLRALGAVLGSLADLGYDARWTGLRAADAGAPHNRFRIFVIAYPAGGGLMPTPAVNDMGAGKTVEAWDAWTAKMQAKHQNGNGHGPSLSIEAQRIELLRSPKASEGQGGALGEAEALRRGNTVGVRDQIMDLVSGQGLKVSRSEVNGGGLVLMPTPNTMDSLPPRTPEQIAESKLRTPAGYSNLRETVVNGLSTDTNNEGP